MDMSHGHDGHGMMMAPPPSPSSSSNSTMMPPPHHSMMMMHMSFYWGKDAVVLFSGWPGSSPGMYVLSLFVVFLLAVLVEWLSRSHFVKPGATSDVVLGVVRTTLHALRMGLAYLVMLAVMSFNGGVFIAAIVGHALGFFVFGTRDFGSGSKGPGDEKASDLPPMSC